MPCIIVTVVNELLVRLKPSWYGCHARTAFLRAIAHVRIIFYDVHQRLGYTKC